MDYLEIVGVFLIIFSLLLIIKPILIFKLNRFCNKIIFTDSEFFTSPKISSTLFVAVGIFIIYLGYYIKDMVSIVKL